MADNDPNKRTDKCGNPFPDVCTPQQVRTPICYLTPTLVDAGVPQDCGIPGFLIIDVAADCTGTVLEIQDAEGTPVPNAFQVPCPSTLGTGGF
jgi:hypothetical protein